MKPIVETTPREAGKAMSKCLKNGIRIYPVPYGYNFKIIIERNGKPKPGKDVFPAKAEKDKPGVFDKIRELYDQIAEKIDKPKPVLQS